MDSTNTLTERLEELKRLNRNRFDYVLARANSKDVKSALEICGMSKSWYYDFPPEERERLEALANELHYEKNVQAWLILQDAATEAAGVKVDGLRSRDQRVKQQAATEILDRTIGKPGENVKHSGSINFVWQPHKPSTSAGES